MSLVWYSPYHGDEWEKMCDALLSLKHGADFQPISDKSGDLGLDGLVVSQGIAYQAYGQEPENQDPSKGVKSKIHTDLAKLKKNQEGIVKLLGGKKISRWVLLLNKEIPHNNIHAYAKSKQDEVLSWQLSFLDDGFQVVIQTPTYFETEYLEYKKRRDDRIEVDIPLQTSPSMENIRLNEKFIAVFDKFRRITDTDEDVERFSGMIPSELMAYAREIARLEQEIDDLGELSGYSQNMFEKMKEIFDRYQLRNKILNGLKSDLSDSDKGLLRKFQAAFRKYLEKLGYNSYEIEAIFIDEATFLPRVTVNSLDQKKRMKADFGSSASDWIRIITAYTLALHISRGNSSKSNHPNISVFDEPAQQNMDKADHLELYPLVAEVCDAGGQVIIAATDKDHTVRLKAEALGMNIIDFGSNYVLAEEADVASE